MQISNVLAGYSLGDADILRRAMGKKSAEEMERQKIRFLEGAGKKNINVKKADKIFDLMAQFAGYGFNKSHSAAYAYVAYITAYLKAHFPIEFMSGLLTSETGNTDKVVKYINECRERGIKVLPPDINKSLMSFAPDGEAIRFGLGAIKNLGQGAVESILAARAEGGPFKSIFEFTERVDLSAVNKRAIESLIKAGAMDSLEGTRSQLFAAIDRAMEHGQKVRRDRESGQAGLFGDMFGGADAPQEDLPKVPDWKRMQALQGEKEMIGFYVSGHPLDDFEDRIADLRSHETDQLAELPRNFEVKLCGILTNIQRRRSKEGKLYVTLGVEDHKGVLEGMIFNGRDNDHLIDDLSPHLTDDNACLITATVMPDEGAAPRLRVKDLLPLANARVPLPSIIAIRVRLIQNGHDPVSELRALFDSKPGNAQVRLKLESPRDFSAILDVQDRVRPDREFRRRVEEICGADSVEVLQN